ncbi:divergent polysaccharide deacetylase family protein [Aliarcobacter butzleri]|uniref:divergent polysaccharide deacetylase family protein n=1 Tax=Aliarcobacter butzleri TaxID=28197 RepID=UPI00125F0F53|nr:divergent polysaccharide deacetylase family protein [Aliarcobacter butzleri]MCT7601655.1 divergent polysaccharide deacetylase family protein [Aliarcobacter butzleri]MCT7605431.1 divergent polysaccharide deacetylase family protein [Aliarcobacter butzleri]
MNLKKIRLRKKLLQRYLKRKKLAQIFLLISLLLLLIPTISYFYINNESSSKEDTKLEQKATNEEVMKEVLTQLEISKKDILKENNIFSKEIDINHKILEKVKEIKDNKKEYEQTTEIGEENIPLVEEKAAPIKKDTYVYNKKDKPKIAIIIDDVVSDSQKSKISNIGYPITMAFLPPTNTHKDSAKIAQNVPFHMIHFPLQASSAFKGEEINTLKITDSYETIENRVKQLRNWYPNAKYTNNHTGSVFTENDEAMDKLFKALVKYNFIFVDSKTSAKSVGQKYANKYNLPYISRNIFLDNEKSYEYIKSQLIKTIELAKKHGYAVAIGHPYDITLKVLKESKHLLNDVDPILVNKLPHL